MRPPEHFHVCLFAWVYLYVCAGILHVASSLRNSSVNYTLTLALKIVLKYSVHTVSTDNTAPSIHTKDPHLSG